MNEDGLTDAQGAYEYAMFLIDAFNSLRCRCTYVFDQETEATVEAFDRTLAEIRALPEAGATRGSW